MMRFSVETSPLFHFFKNFTISIAFMGLNQVLQYFKVLLTSNIGKVYLTAKNSKIKILFIPPDGAIQKSHFGYNCMEVLQPFNYFSQELKHLMISLLLFLMKKTILLLKHGISKLLDILSISNVDKKRTYGMDHTTLIFYKRQANLLQY